MSARPTRVAVIAGRRTPFARAGTALRAHDALALGRHAVEGLLGAVPVSPEAVDELALGTVVVDPRVPHLAREVVLRSHLPATVRALTLVDNCITGVSALACVADSIRAGRAGIGIAGGVESLSNPPVLFSRRASRRFVDLARARGLAGRVGRALRLRPGDFLPCPPALVEPSTGLSMGEHCELMVRTWDVSRAEQDAIALRSHRRAHAATVDGRLTAEIAPLAGLDRDNLVRPDTTLEKLAGLAPVFDRSGAGTITAGTSSALTDGAAAVLLASEARVQSERLEPLAWLRAVEFASIDPADGLLMGPGVAVPRLLARTGLDLEDMDVVEVHEAFAGQVACNLRAWERGWKEPAIGTIAPDRLNRLGGSIALGHPFAATGARIVTTLANEIARGGGRYGLASICGAGATAVALVLERP